MNNPQVTKWEARYRNGDWEDASPHSLVSKAAETLLAGEALDIACGTGRHALALAERGWRVKALDAAPAALEIVRKRASALHLDVVTVCADCEAESFRLEPDGYDLIVVTNFLHRPLFAQIRRALRVGGVFVGVIAVQSEELQAKQMNPAFLLQPGELRGYFSDWALLHDFEGQAASASRVMAEIMARRV